MVDAICIHRPCERDEYDFREGCRILEIWNREDDPGVSIARARVAPGVSTRLHRLSGVVERYLILSGTGDIARPGEAARTVIPGDLVFIPSGQPQRITNTGETDLVFLAICTPRFEPHVYKDLEDVQLPPR